LLTAASSNYTSKQLEALATRVGQTYWIAAVDNRTPPFVTAPARNAPSFAARDNDSFEIVEVTQQKDRDAYYRVRFNSGKEAFIRADVFLEEFNLRILTIDPLADAKQKAAVAAEDERNRVKWIQSQPWPARVKEAAIERRALPGLTAAEVKRILGDPVRVTKAKVQRSFVERWHYADGSVLVFHNQLLNSVEAASRPAP
jgi:hypothetical protein